MRSLRIHRPLVVATIAVLLAIALNAIPASAGSRAREVARSEGSASRLKLAGRTVITGSRSAVVPVRIPRPVTVSAIDSFSTIEQEPNPDLQVTGAGRVFGMVLSQNKRRFPKEETNSGATLTAIKYGMCSGVGCEPVRSGVDVVTAFGPGVDSQGESATDERYVLPGGNYKLYLLADGAPVSVILKLHGLSGRTTLRPSVPADVHVSEATPQDSLGIRYAASDDYAFRGRGMVVVAHLTRSSVASAPIAGWCIVKQNQEPAPTDPADGPTMCESRQPAALIRRASGDNSDSWIGGGGTRAWAQAGDYPAGQVWFVSSFLRGRYRVSQHYVTTPLDNSRGFIALWLGWS